PVAGVELAAMDREPFRILNVVVIVVERLASGDERPELAGEILRMVRRLKIAVSPPVTEAVDPASGKKWNPRHLDQPHRKSPRAEEQEIRDERERRPKQAEWFVDAPFDHIVRRALPILLDESLVVGGRV